jgi:hypothetical protein
MDAMGTRRAPGDYVNRTQSCSRWPLPDAADAGEGRVAARPVAAGNYDLGRRMTPTKASLVEDGAEQSLRRVAQYAQLGQRCISPLGIFSTGWTTFFFSLKWPGLARFGPGIQPARV